MRAAVVREFHADLSIEQTADPTCPDDGVVLEVAACGVCRSDYHGWTGGHPKVQSGSILGHEYCGTVVEAGPRATYAVGDRLIAPFFWPVANAPPATQVSRTHAPIKSFRASEHPAHMRSTSRSPSITT